MEAYLLRRFPWVPSKATLIRARPGSSAGVVPGDLFEFNAGTHSLATLEGILDDQPLLQRRLFELPIRPVLVEVRSDALDGVVGAFVGQWLGIRNVIRRFAMVGLIGVPAKLMPVINNLPGVRAVHDDLEANVLQTLAPPGEALVFPTSESRNVMESELAFRESWTE